MLERRWRHGTAKVILMAFGASSIGCGGSPSEQAAPTSTTTVVSSTLAPPTTAMSLEAPDTLSDADLRKLVAPVALYPDVVLASLLPATTYPEQIGEAAEWLEARGGAVDAVPDDRGWDGSVAGLLQFPDVLRWAHENTAWTAEMGSAMTYQQGDVLDAIQRYRGDVAKVGNLESNDYQKVVRANDEIRIEPAKPDTVYVPHYDPAAATQPQPEGQGLNPWIVFGGGAVVGALGAWALYSIFHDDDDGDGGRRRPRRRVRRVNNYYYAGRPRPRAEVWTPRPRPKTVRRRRPDAFEPKPLRRAEAARRTDEPGRHRDGVRPPGRHAGQATPGAKAKRAGDGTRAKKGPGKNKNKNAKKRREKNGEQDARKGGGKRTPGQGNR